jgi:hypothetical protein
MTLTAKQKKQIEAEERYRAEIKSKVSDDQLPNDSMMLYNKIVAWIHIIAGWSDLVLSPLVVIFSFNSFWTVLIFSIFAVYGYFHQKLARGLLAHKNSGRIAVMVWSFLLLFAFPIGTIWSIWNFYFYNRRDIVRMFSK